MKRPIRQSPPEKLKREIMDNDEWDWFANATRDSKLPNLLIVSSLPFLLPNAIHELESSSETSGKFPWNLNPLAQIIQPLIQEEVDLEHWSAFSNSFNRMLSLLEEILTAPGVKKRFIAILSGSLISVL